MNQANAVDSVLNIKWTPKPTKTTLPKPATMDIWIDRLAGSSEASINDLQKGGHLKLSTRTSSQTKQMLRALANQKHAPHKGQVPRSSIPGHKMWGDAQGPNVRSFIYHYVYVFGWLDDCTNFGIVIFTQKKSEAKQAFLRMKAWVPHKLKVISTDGAKEYFSDELQEIATNAEIYWTKSPAYLPQLNARIEHWWYRTDVLTRYMLSRCGASKIFWAFAKAYAVVIINAKLYGPTAQIPYEHYLRQHFPYGKLRVFGCTVTITHMTKRDQTTKTFQKHNDRSQLGFYLGFDAMKYQHLCYGLDTKRVHEGADFTPFEQNFGALHHFQNRNPHLEPDIPQQLQELLNEAESQGEKFDETKLQPNYFGVSTQSLQLWDQSHTKHQIDTTVPIATAEPAIEARQEGESPVQTTTTEKDTPNNTVAEPATEKRAEGEPPEQTTAEPVTSVDQPDPEPTSNPDSMDVEVSDGIAPPELPEPASNPDADASEVQERIIQHSTEPPSGSLRSHVEEDPTKPVYTPNVAPSRANKEVQELAKQNDFHKHMSNWVTLMTCFMSTDTSEEDKLELRWQNNVEYAMHAFCVQGIKAGGFWTDYTFGSRRKGRKRPRGPEYILESAMPTMDGPEPQTFKQAQNWGSETPKYMEATDAEMQGHKINGTFVPCELPQGVTAIDSRFVYVRKVNPDGTIRYKARWVARGFTQVDGENFNWDTVFAPVLRMTSLRWMFSLVAEFGLELTGADVVQAFLQADLREDDELKDIYVRLPKGYETTCPTTGRPMQYGRLVKALYGLKQAPRRWAEKLTSVMKKLGFKPHPEDPCIFIMRKGNSVLIYGIYVDDMIKATNDPALRKQVDKVLSQELKIEHQGELKEFLGLEFCWKENKQGQKYLNVCQKKYCEKILKRFGMDNAKPEDLPWWNVASDTPCMASGKPEDVYLWPNKEPPENVDKELLDRYRAGIGALIYLSVMTRPDISYAVGACASFMSNPNTQHETALMRIFRYIKGTTDYSLKYFKTGKGMTMEVYVDANYMGDHDSRSTTGILIFSGNGIIDWASKRQPTIATSTAHAETTAFFEAVKRVVYIRRLIKGFDMPELVLHKPTIVNCDNAACVELTRKRVERQDRTKHWQMQWNWLHDIREQHQFYPIHKEGTKNWSDMGTKPLTRELHRKICNAIRLPPE